MDAVVATDPIAIKQSSVAAMRTIVFVASDAGMLAAAADIVAVLVTEPAQVNAWTGVLSTSRASLVIILFLS